jgi:hypothetical protein
VFRNPHSDQASVAYKCRRHRKETRLTKWEVGWNRFVFCCRTSSKTFAGSVTPAAADESACVSVRMRPLDNEQFWSAIDILKHVIKKKGVIGLLHIIKIYVKNEVQTIYTSSSLSPVYELSWPVIYWPRSTVVSCSVKIGFLLQVASWIVLHCLDLNHCSEICLNLLTTVLMCFSYEGHKMNSQ